MEPKKIVKEWISTKSKVNTDESVEALDNWIDNIVKKNAEINKLCLDLKECYLFEVNTTTIKKEFNTTCVELIKYVLDKIFTHIGKQVDVIDKTYKDIQDKLKKPPENEGEWVTLKEYIKNYKSNLLRLAEE